MSSNSGDEDGHEERVSPTSNGIADNGIEGDEDVAEQDSKAASSDDVSAREDERSDARRENAEIDSIGSENGNINTPDARSLAIRVKDEDASDSIPDDLPSTQVSY